MSAQGSTRSRSWFITINANYEVTFNALKKEKYRCLIIGAKELAPLTGHEHYHCFIYYDNAKTFSVMQKKLFGANIQVAKGTIEQIKAYCSKDGEFLFEDGEVPHQGSQRVIAAEVKKMTTEEVIETYGKSSLTMLKVRDLLNAKININDWHKEIKVVYITGPSGIGKSEKAKDIVIKYCEEKKIEPMINEVKCCNGYWNGVSEDTEIAIYDDFRDSSMVPSEFINFIDYNKHILNTKGAHVRNNYKLIIITSVQNPMEIYKNSMSYEAKEQWLRRMEIIDLTPNENLGDILSL